MNAGKEMRMMMNKGMMNVEMMKMKEMRTMEKMLYTMESEVRI